MIPALIALAALPLARTTPAPVAGPSDNPDLIVLADGKEVECRVLYEDSEVVVYTTKRKAVEVPRAEVASVQSIERSLADYLARFDEVGEDVAGLLKLADFCDKRGLYGEARHLRMRVITLDAANEEAWTKLGGVYDKRRGWRVRVRGRYLSLEQLRERVADWKNALEIPTAHFLIKTDGVPEKAFDLAIDVERAYLEFYEHLGPVLRLYPFDEVPELHVYASSADFPAPPVPGKLAWYSLGENALYIDGERVDSVPEVAVAEFAQLMLWNSMFRTVGKSGSVPAWARSAIEQSFAGGFRADPGHASWDFSEPIKQHFATHASSEKPLSLQDVVNAGWRRFESGEQQRQYQAQAYTLLQFLAYGDDGAYRDQLGAYLIGAFGGQGAATHLRKALDMKESEIESRWLEWVRGQLGG